MIGRTALCLLGLLIHVTASTAFAQERVFTADAGMLFHPILKEKTTDFERVIQRVRDALRASTSTVRQQQAESWKVYQSIEAGPQDSVLYVFVVDPTLTAADYTIGNILREELPLEAQALYEAFASSYAYSPSLINLRLVADFAQAETPASGLPPVPAAVPPDQIVGPQ